MTLKNGLMLLALLLLVTSAQGALAKDHKKNDHAKDRIVWDKGDHKALLAIDTKDRTLISNYLRQHYGRNCPPGLAKKNNGCLPPGQAKKYAIGRPIGAYNSLPADLSALLSPPRGHRYVQVDKDVVLISEAGKKVIDAVTLLSATGN